MYDLESSQSLSAMQGYSSDNRTHISGPSLFPASKFTTINGGTFQVFGSSNKKQKQRSHYLNGKRVKVKVIPRHKIQFLRQIHKSHSSRFSSALRKGSEVMIQVFEGPHSQELWEQTVDFASNLVNAHLQNLIGSSPDEPSDKPQKHPCYLVFDGRGCRNTHHLLASLLRAGAMQTTLVGMHMVHGIASGLDYLFQQENSLNERYLKMWHNSRDVLANDFTLFSNDLGHTTIAFTPEFETQCNDPVCETQIKKQEIELGLEDNSNDLETLGEYLCATLIQRAFHDANKLIYMDAPKRDYMPWNDLDDIMINQSSDNKQLGKAIEGISRSTLDSHPSKRLCRREIVWRSYDQYGTNKASLGSIIETYQNLLDSLAVTSSHNLAGISLPHYRNLPMLKMPFDAQCFCGGYSWEEIILKPNAFTNKVLTYRLCWRCCFEGTEPVL
ncbi:hypothetical protein F5051DRAFT_451967 [Lentinula edodes]|nr:hypothetical protein F5051DRAFT_451967 [Lentinula edodes]